MHIPYYIHTILIAIYLYAVYGVIRMDSVFTLSQPNILIVYITPRIITL